MHQVATAKLCETCGLAVDAAMLTGFCPGCLLEMVLQTGPDSVTLTRIEDYELLDEVARGGMGIVYRARQRLPSRIVALKMILPAHLNSPGALNRFRAEAEAAASLDYEGILPIYAVGEHDGAPFYSMKFAEGGTLASRIDSYRNKHREVAALMAKVARAVAHAHEHGILHRDLKPGNILFDSTGKPYVSDFGLAKWLQPESDLTQTLSILGTPSYMAPEQARNSKAVTAAADTYSLGAILYHLLAGRPAVEGDTPLEVLHRAGTKPPPPPGVPRDLATICLKCLEEEPAARFESAAALAEDLDRFVAGRPILARPVGFTQRTWRWMRRTPLVAALFATTLGLLLALGFVTYRQRPNPSNVVPAKTLAVLPFANSGEDKGITNFADGVQDEILTSLARIAELKAISRTSTIGYKSGLPRNLPEIAKQLGVANVVEGSVQRAGNRIRVNVRLVDAQSDQQLWAHLYDRELSDLFAVQSEIAQAIAAQLQAKISERERAAITKPATTDLLARSLYLQARDVESDYSQWEQNLHKAVGLLEEAVARDPAFVLGHCALGQMHLELFHWFDRNSARRNLADVAIQKAVRLAPDAGEVHRALAMYAYWGFLHYDRARAELELARRTLPNDSDIYYLLGLLDRRQSRWTEAIRSFERALELDPRNAAVLSDTAITYGCLRRYPQATEVFDRLVAVAPRNRLRRAWVPFDERADVGPLRAFLSTMLTEHPEAAERFVNDLFSCAMAERDPGAVERALSAITAKGVPGPGKMMLPREFFAGLAARAFGRTADAEASFTAARAIAEGFVRDQPETGIAWSFLAQIESGLGRKEETHQAARRAKELLPNTGDAFTEVDLVTQLAIAYAWIGESDLALEQLARSARTPAGVTYGQLKLDPQWDPLRGDPRFERIVASLAPKAAL